MTKQEMWIEFACAAMSGMDATKTASHVFVNSASQAADAMVGECLERFPQSAPASQVQIGSRGQVAYGLDQVVDVVVEGITDGVLAVRTADGLRFGCSLVEFTLKETL